MPHPSMLIGNLRSQRHQRVIEPHARSGGDSRKAALESLRPKRSFRILVIRFHLAQEP